MNVNLSEELKSFLFEFVPDRFEQLVESYEKPFPETFRVNTLKISQAECLELLAEDGIEATPIPYTEDGFYVKPPGTVSTTLWHMLGYVYVQGPVSILITELLDVKPGMKVLDLCAAPGSKTTHIAAKLQRRGVVVANDVSRTRIKALASNMQRCGVVNGFITLSDGRCLGYRHRRLFDRVLVDAPCTSLGIGSKDWSVLKYWTVRSSQRLGRLQRSLLLSGYQALKPGGSLIYSTCTFHPYENEYVVSALLEKFPDAKLEPLNIQNLSYEKGLESWQGVNFPSEVTKTVRIYPFHSGAEGFYIAKIIKPG
ncbi:MAG: RsmB/NOP family class I SAM-dependent RNA methyltransferase [Candidatus Caldarchaeum sp.]